MTTNYEYFPVSGSKSRGDQISRDDEKAGTIQKPDENVKSDQNDLMPTPSIFGSRMQTWLLFLLAIASSLGHHFFYASLNNRSAQDGGIFAPLRSSGDLTTSDQAIVNTLGTLIARIAATCMSAAIGLSFVQIFWRHLRNKARTLRQIDTVLKFKTNVFNFLAWSAVPHAFWLALVALCATITEFVSVVTPGSLTVAPVTLSESCQVNTVDLSMADFSSHILSIPTIPNTLWPTPNERVLSLVSSILVSGTYLAPSLACAPQSSNCQYGVTFVAPAVQCTNITQATDISSLLNDENAGTSTHVWYAGPDDTDPIALVVASRNMPGSLEPNQQMVDLDTLPVVALNCTGWNATYYATVQQQDSNTTVTINEINYGAELQGIYDNSSSSGSGADASQVAAMQPLVLWEALMSQMSGNVSIALPSALQFWSEPALQPCVYWSTLGRSGNPFGWEWAGDLQQLIPEVMQNISISLLSATLSGNYTAPKQASVCSSSRLSFVYNRARLLATYGAGLALTLACMAFGLVAERKDGHEETLEFSRILAAYPSSSNTILTRDTVLHAGKDGRLEPTDAMEGNDSTHELQSLEAA